MSVDIDSVFCGDYALIIDYEIDFINHNLA